jgi:hypothetical protein
MLSNNYTNKYRIAVVIRAMKEVYAESVTRGLF